MIFVLTEISETGGRSMDWSVSDAIALGALILSIIAIGISIFALQMEKKLNTINLQAVFFEEIFKIYFIEKIPEAVRKLSFKDNGKLKSSYRELISTLMEMMEQSSYFFYAKREFYDELKKLCMALEDKLVDKSNECVASLIQQNEFIHSVEEDISAIVKCINDNYSN